MGRGTWVVEGEEEDGKVGATEWEAATSEKWQGAAWSGGGGGWRSRRWSQEGSTEVEIETNGETEVERVERGRR